MVNSDKPKRLDNTVNAGSMADIAFLLLIFFLVTTTIEVDKGIMVRLPPYTTEDKAVDISSRNVFRILINSADDILAREENIAISEIAPKIKNFLVNPNQSPILAVSPKKAVVSLQNDRSTKYTTYVAVYNEIKRAYNELRNEQALKEFGKSFAHCPIADQRYIRTEIPLVISEAEPTDYLP